MDVLTVAIYFCNDWSWIMDIFLIILAILGVIYWFWKISIPKYPGFSDEDHKKDRDARKEIKKQLKEEQKRARK